MIRAALLTGAARFFGIALMIPAFSPFIRCNAQVMDPVTAAQEPIPGAGHHYIGTGSETVNPVDGSVSFELPIQTPSGRQLSLPFGISFNSAEPFFLADGGNDGFFHWMTPTLNGWAPPFELNGWSYKLPTYEAQAYVAYSVASPTSDPPDSFVYDYCWSTQNYTFRGLEGTRYPLNVAYGWSDPRNPDHQPCGQGNLGSFSGSPLYGVAASLANGISGPGDVSTQPALTVADRSGTVYQFAQGPGVSTNPTVVAGGATPFGALAQTITDRNGNEIRLNGSGVYTAGVLLSAGSYTDTLGRNVLAWTGLGNTSGDQITISGLSSNIVVKWTTTTVTLPQNSQFVSASYGSTCAFGGGSQTLSMAVVSEIDLPNGQMYTFSYGGTWGLLSKITFPDGGYVRYLWGTNPSSQSTYQTWNLTAPNTSGPANCTAIVDTPAITDRFVSYDGSTEVLHQQFTSYSTSWVDPPNGTVPYWTSKSVTVTSNDLITGQATVTKYSYGSVVPLSGPGPWNWQDDQVPVEKSVAYQDGSGTLQTVNKTWLDQYAMVGSQTILDNAQGMTTLRCVDSSDRVLAEYEYNFQSAGGKPGDPSCPYSPSGQTTLSGGLNLAAIGPLLRETATAYHNFGINSNILDEPDSVTVSNSSGNRIKQTSYIYDGSGVYGSGAKVGLTSPPGPRGNATSVSRWLNTSNALLTTTYTYFDTGQVQTVTDACGNASCPDVVGGRHIATFYYSDSFAVGTGSPSGQTNAYLTQVTNALGYNDLYTWGFADGLIRSHEDENTQTTTYEYNDPLLRLKQVQGPLDPNNGNQPPTTTYDYPDWTPANPEPSQIKKSILENTSGTTVKSTTILDGMGHPVHSLATSDPAGADTVDTVYGGLGWVYTVSNPYRSASETTYGLTTSGYDALGRKTSQINSDNTSTQTWQYHGNVVTYTDENQNPWQRTTDALGRLIKVVEPNGAETDYSYDLLDDFIAVNQCGGPCPSAGAIARQFTYDSLGRLIQSYNPEAGWTCYGATGGAAPNGSNCQSGYDANGNLAVKTDARNIVTNYSYDALNRVLSKSYQNDPSGTPSACYQYDLFSVPNSVGRLTGEWTQSASKGSCGTNPPSSDLWSRRSILAYDPMGRILKEQQCTPSSCTSGTPYAPTYTYDLAGNATSSTNGITSTPAVGSLVMTNLFDGVGRIQSVTSNWTDSIHPATLFTAQAGSTLQCTTNSSPYAAFGGLMNATYGTGLALNRSYDKRLRTSCEVDTGGAVVNATSGSATVTITGTEQSK